MKKIGWVVLLVGCAWLMSSCTPPTTPAANTAAGNSNAAAKPAAAATAADALLANDKGATEAYMKGDGSNLNNFIGDKFISYGSGSWHGKADIASSVPKMKCDVKG